MTTVLVTGIGGDVSQGVARILRTRKNVQVIGTDVSLDNAGRLYADRVFQVPRATEPGFRDALVAILNQQEVDVAIPVPEPELAVIFPFPATQRRLRWITSGEVVVRTGIDKLETARRLAAAGIPVPWTRSAKEGPQEMPCVYKGRFGSGSRSFANVHDAEDVAYLVKRIPDGVFQELLLPADQEITCAVYRTLDDRVAVLCLRRRLAGGVTAWAEVVRDSAIHAMCVAIARALDLRGSMNVQLRLTERGPRVFEINPRFSSTAWMRHLLGFSDVLWALDEALGRSVDLCDVPAGIEVVRIHDAVVMEATKS